MTSHRKNPAIPATLLVTPEEKRAVVDRILKKFPNIGKVFLPDNEFYADHEAYKQLKIIHVLLANWLGIPVKKVHINFSSLIESSGKYTNDNNRPVIDIHLHYANNPYFVAAIVAHCLIHYLVDKTIGLDSIILEQQEEIIDLVSINAGFGIITADCYAYSEGILYDIKHKILGVLGSHKSFVQFGFYKRQEYISICNAVFDEYQVLPQTYQYYLLPKARKYFKITKNINQQNSADFVRIYKKRVRKNNSKLLLIATSILTVITVLSVWLINMPKPLTTEEKSLKYNAALLHRMYDLCEQSVTAEQSLLDTNDQLIEQRINTDASRCNSLRTQYNEAATSYNNLITK